MADSEIHQQDGRIVAFIGDDAMRLAKARLLRSSIKGYIKFKIIPTRGMTITRMLEEAGKFTGKHYKSSHKELAVEDLEKWILAMQAALPVVERARG